MKRILTIFLFFFLILPHDIYSQPGREKVEALRMSFISKRLALSNAESEKFWPLYNEYNDKVKAIRRNLKQNYKHAQESLNDKSAEELYQLDLQSKQAETDVHKAYSEKLRAVIGVKKMVLLRLAEEDFKREMMDIIKGERSD
jgi:hypothetical protein